MSRRRSSLLSALLFLTLGGGLACSRGGSPPDGTASKATVDLGEPSEKPPTDTQTPQGTGASASATAFEADHYLVGEVGASGNLHCPDGDRKWVNVRPAVGLVTLVGDKADALLERRGDVVVVGGSPTDSPPAMEKADGLHCPAMQMRSDWVDTPAGIIKERDGASFDAFGVAEVAPFVAKAKRVGEDVTVSFDNPVPFDLKKVRVVFHYEGCFGKPGAHAEKAKPQDWANGTVLTATAAAVHESGSRSYRLDAVQLLAKDKRVTFEQTISVGSLGADIRCPEK